MPAIRSTSADPNTRAGILAKIVRQNNCPDCGGALKLTEYKGRDAAVCEDCGTPRSQLFGDRQ